MIRKVVFIFSTALMLASCGSGKEEKTGGKDSVATTVAKPNSKEGILAKIAELEKQTMAQGLVKPDQTLTQKMINAYNEYVLYYPDDTLSANFAFKSATVAVNTYNNDQAIVLIDSYLKNYESNKEKRLELLILKAMIYDDRMNADDRAKIVYEEIIKDYPDSPAAAQAKDAMKLLGKSDAELIKEFEKKNGLK